MKDALVVISGGGFCQLETALGCLKAVEEVTHTDLHNSSSCSYQATSAGAIAAGMMMMPALADQAIMIVRAAGETDLIHRKFLWPLRMWFGDHAIYDRDGLERFMKELFRDDEYSNMAATVTKLKGLTPEYPTGRYRTILASTSIEQIFPAVTINGAKYIDGGYTDNVPIHDWQLSNYRHAFIILYPDDPFKIRHRLSWIGSLLEGFSAKMDQEVDEAERTYSDRQHYPNVTVLRPSPTVTSLLSFSEDFKLINHAYRYAVDKLHQEGTWQ